MDYSKDITERQLSSYKATLTKLVDRALKNAKKKGWRLERGAWLTKYEDEDNGSVCAVGAIGLLYKPKPKQEWHTGNPPFPFAVAPLIRNGAAVCVDDRVLHTISEGFEGQLFGEITDHHILTRRPRLRRYFQFCYGLGKKVYRMRMKERG